jgi:hypothetical protein
MNYFAHGIACICRPYQLAGTALPDWLSASDRAVRIRPRDLQALGDTADPRLAELASGIQRHWDDDARFHVQTAFVQLCATLTQPVRHLLAHDARARPGFVVHVLVELLLDSCLAQAAPQRLQAYYAALQQVEPRWIEAMVNRVARRPTQRLAPFIAWFREARFLFDYADDGKLWFRLGAVVRRLGLPELPAALRWWLPEARAAVAGRFDELLQGIVPPSVACGDSATGLDSP